MSDRRVAIEILGREGVSASHLVPAHVAQRPVQLGATSEIAIAGEGVAPLHLVLLVKDDRLLLATVRGGADAFTEAGAIPSTWTEIALPTHVLLGETVLHLFWVVAFVGRESQSRRLVVRRKTPAKGLPIVTPPPRRAFPSPLPPPLGPSRSSSSITRTSETQLHAVPRPPPAPSPPRRSPPRLGDALGGMVIDQTPTIDRAPVFPQSRPSSPTIVEDLGRRSGVKPMPREPNPVDAFFTQIVATWKRVEGWLSSSATKTSTSERAQQQGTRSKLSEMR